MGVYQGILDVSSRAEKILVTPHRFGDSRIECFDFPRFESRDRPFYLYDFLE